MARRVYTDFDAELLLRLSNRTDITSTQRGFFLNDAMRYLINTLPHPEFEGTETGTVTLAASTYSFTATDVDWVVFVKDTTNDRALDFKTIEFLESQRTVSGPITKYTYWGGQLIFDRTADASTGIRIRYKKTAVEWTSGSPSSRQLFDPLLLAWAAKLALETVGNMEAAHIQETLYANHLSELKLSPVESVKNDTNQGIRVRMK